MYKIINLPKDEKEAPPVAELVAKAFNTLGVAVNGDVFVPMWANGDIKVILEFDGSDVVGICILRHGNNSAIPEKTATIIDIRSNKSVNNLFEFACTVAQALGCQLITSTLTNPIEGIDVIGYYQEKRL